MASNFLDLPREIRDVIYEFSCREPIVVQVINQMTSPDSAHCFDPVNTIDFDMPFKSLLLVSHQIKEEFMEILWQHLHLDLRALRTLLLICDFAEKYPSLVRKVRTVTCHVRRTTSVLDLWTGDLSESLGHYEYELEHVYASWNSKWLPYPQMETWYSRLPVIPYQAGSFRAPSEFLQNLRGTRFTFILAVDPGIYVRDTTILDRFAKYSVGDRPIPVAFVKIELNLDHTHGLLSYYDEDSVIAPSLESEIEHARCVSRPFDGKEQELRICATLAAEFCFNDPKCMHWKHHGRPGDEAKINVWRMSEAI